MNMTPTGTPSALRELAQQWRDGGKGVMPLLIEQAADELSAARAEIAEKDKLIEGLANGQQVQVAVVSKLRAEIAELRERCAAEVPTNWLDPLLTGPDAALSNDAGKWGCPDIERLLRAVAARIRALAKG